MNQQISFPEWVEREEQAGRGKPTVAAALKIEVASLYRYLSKDRVPSKAVMDRIIKASGGVVDIGWFYSPKVEQVA
ncbi:hypothetical protein [Devosia ginsengisoli]|uniref:Helix-turn-helix transcriptional regulator n=1 Tax=Devosia ginsengisoli TaxID=400770 RepID=A0A5B8LRN7_9HYPH|nr:hypothetical protein [Devosia ginsengisoli]QDZ10549.1 hypothetical protein FPZ08_07165 [Devosia ginsengisoli]